MGHALAERVAVRGHAQTAMLGMEENVEGRGVAAFRSVTDVAIEFTEPASAVANIRACVDAGIPVVVGTTGWYDRRAEIEAYVRTHAGSVLIAPNFSLGVALTIELARVAGELFRFHPDFEPVLIETHHAQKQDAPSGTAQAMAAAASSALGGRTVPVSSIRVGSVPGTHELVFDGPFEQIVVRHEARDRRVFADGAVRAAEWLAGQRGVFTMRDMLGMRSAAR
jgi:4-hydroxy-tetrahydrodipicolinate reductase